jgi:SAM-dependent methyltransferase
MTASTSSDPHGMHDWHSAAYVDEWIDKDVTRDDERRPLLRRAAQLIPADRADAIRVLDVGGGYGMLTREVHEEFPHATVVLHDFSEPMFEQARRRLAEHLDRLEFAQADLRDPGWAATLPGPFDAIVSAIAIHNVREPEVIQRVYADIHGLLRPSSAFYNVDFVAPAGRVGAAAMSGRRPDDRPLRGTDRGTLVDQLAWLRDAGFDQVDCLARDGYQAVLAGFRD